MRNYRDWQFFNRKPEGSKRLMQACYNGKLWSFGFGTDPARIWFGRLSKHRKQGAYAFHFHMYLPFNGRGYRWTPSIGFRKKNGQWVNFPAVQK